VSPDDEARLSPLMSAILRPRIGHAPQPWPQSLRIALAALAEKERTSCDALLTRAVASPRSDIVSALIAGATVTHTSFFRHRTHFERLESELKRSARPVRIWSAACATGEEPYSIALTARAAFVRATIVATDVNEEALAIAQRGRYAAAAVRRAGIEASGSEWEVPASVREMVRFQRASITDTDPAPGESSFDYVFCRNVLIYLDPATGERALTRMLAKTKGDGAIVVAPVEALRRMPGGLTRVDPLGWLDRHVPSRPAPPPVISVPVEEEDALQRAARALGAGALEDAETALHETLARSPTRSEAWFLLGELLERRGERTQARTAFASAAQHADQSPEGRTLANAALKRAE
jgi:chemotaxis protein methyltransferase CheR